MAAVISRASNNSPLPRHRMGSPKDVKRSNPKIEVEPARRDSSHQTPDDVKPKSPPRSEAAQAVQPPEKSVAADSKPLTTNTTNAPIKSQPLGPPPRPGASDAPDYFNQHHSQPISNTYTAEPNPFESQFGSSSETPGKNLLPPVASLTSPQSLLPSGTPGWGSLRSGPLSPAMLAGPTGTNDYFGEAPFSRGFPTPNESSLRTGLTPGGGGSMFPAPSPNTQALFNSLQPSGGATPGTLEFLRTVGRASAANHGPTFGGPTSQPNATEPQTSQANMEVRPPPQAVADPFGHPDADAANGLYLLAQANGLRNIYQPAAVKTNLNSSNNAAGARSQETSPLTKTANRASIGTVSGDTAGGSETDRSEPTKPATKSAKGKKNGAVNTRRKAEEAPPKVPANKKAKISSTPVKQQMEMDEDDDDDDMDMNMEETKDGRKMTDEEKRKNFLERNRVAALKCRQRKKQWLANLQTKVELFSTENDALSQTVTQLREEIVNLKSLLLAHRDCPVSAAQGIGGPNMNMFIEGNHHANPYGMGGPPPGMAQGLPMPMPGGGPPGQMHRR